MKVPRSGAFVIEAVPVVQDGVQLVPVELAGVGNDRELVQTGLAGKKKANRAVFACLQWEWLGLVDEVEGSCHLI